jgi:hypothetical protein
LEEENAKLKKLLAEQMLDAAAIRELLSMVGPAAKRAAVAHLQAVMRLSERRAGSIVGADRKMIRYGSSRPPDTALRGRLRDLVNERAPFRLPPTVRRAAAAGRAVGDQPDLPAFSGGRARRPQAAGPSQGRGDPGPDLGGGQAQRTLVAGLRPRPVRQRRRFRIPTSSIM